MLKKKKREKRKRRRMGGKNGVEKCRWKCVKECWVVSLDSFFIYKHLLNAINPLLEHNVDNQGKSTLKHDQLLVRGVQENHQGELEGGEGEGGRSGERTWERRERIWVFCCGEWGASFWLV